MPGKVGVKIKAGRNLPVMDRGSETTDAYVEIKLGSVTHKTDVCRKSLNPQWNTDWFRFEIDDAELQDEPLQIRLMDYDTYSANDAIGKVNISLNPLCLETSGQTTQGKGTVLSGWIPVFDTMHGIRGEVNVIVKVDLFSDLNKFRQSSCGIQFFHSQCIPYGYRAQVIHGFVEELVVNDDPEYQWIDKIRTPRASNEARQVVFLKLSGQVQRKMGLKAINMGANAVIGYTQCFDLEGDVGVVARGIGTAVTLIKDTISQPTTADNALIEENRRQYLSFLTGGTSGCAYVEPEYKLHIQKSQSSASFQLKRTEDELDEKDHEIMLELMRQEDARGEKPQPKKLRDQMRHFTRSSRNLFKQKVSDSCGSEKSLENSIAKSLFVLFPNTVFIREESSSTSSGGGGGSGSVVTPASTGRTTMNEIRKQSFKAKNNSNKPISTYQHIYQQKQRPLIHKPLKKTIVRSFSETTAMKHQHTSTNYDIPVTVAAYDEFQDNTRSSPNIPIEDDTNLPKTIVAVNTGSKVDTLCENDADYSARGSCSSSMSYTISESSSTSAEIEENDKPCPLKPRLCKNMSVQTDDTEDEHEKIDKFIKMCEIQQQNKDDADEQLQYKWIKPNPNRDDSLEDSLDDVKKGHSLLKELKVFSQHMQDLIYTPKKISTIKPVATESVIAFKIETETEQRRLSNTLALPSETWGERKSYYSSQPEIMADSNTSMLALPPDKLQSSQSFTNIRTAAAMSPIKLLPLQLTLNRSYKDLSTITNITTHAATASPILNAQQPKFPILKICPSTPTPSESDSSQVSPTSATNSAKKFASSSSSSSTVSLVSPQTSPTLTPHSFSYKSNVDLDKVNNCSRPSFSLSTSSDSSSNAPNHHNLSKHNTNTSKSSLLAPSSPLFCIKHHRSLNEVNASAAAAAANAMPSIGGTTDSPSMKRFTSPASAAIVAAAGSVMGSRSKLTPSPSKTGIATTLPATMTTTTTTTNATTSTNSSATHSENSTTSTATTAIPKEVGEICRRSSDSDLSVTPKGNSFCVASERLVAATALMRLTQPSAVAGKSSATDSAMDMLEYPFLTMTKYPAGFILHFGATVAARSVKLLERVPNPDEPEIRDSWWTELRMEIRSHARALGCNVVLGYSESTTISDEVCVLSATGTAAVINMAYNRSVSQTDIMPKPAVVGGGAVMSASSEDRDMLKELRNGISETAPPSGSTSTKEISAMYGATSGGGGLSGSKKFGLPPLNIVKNSCTACHIPYNLSSVPFNTKMKRCAICKKGRVPDVLLATLEVPEYLQVTGRGCFMQAQVVRAKKDLRSELNAKEISDGLPFLEYELHRVLINKLKAKGMNAIFGLKAQVAIGERMIALIATGTALFLTALPVPQVPKIVAGNSWTDKQKLNELQKKLQETFERNQEIYQLKCIDPDLMYTGGSGGTDTDESDEEIIEVDLNCGNKDTCVLEVDDIEDLEIISLLMEPYPPEGFHVVNTQMVPGMMDMEAVKNLQMFAQVWRAKLDVGQNVNGFPKHFQRLLQTIYFKLRTMIPCAICDLRFRLDLPESDQIQLLVTGMALGLGDASNKIKYRRKTVTNGTTAPNTQDNTMHHLTTSDMNSGHGQKRTLQEEDYIFPLDEDHMVETPTPTTNLPPYGTHSFKLRKTSPSRQTTSNAKTTSSSFRNRYFPLRDRYGVDITPLCFIPGGKIEKYLGNLNFFFIRESTSIREIGGISGFVHGFITELLAVVRAHIAALGGNAMVSFYMTELILVDNQHKNQGQCLISIGGDAVNVSYYTDD